ncbi:hypothetical protein D918_06935 [Trichuris suis]|nr:hypothetical protein D918_06935 [Trichuris suis]
MLKADDGSFSFLNRLLLLTINLVSVKQARSWLSNLLLAVAIGHQNRSSLDVTTVSMTSSSVFYHGWLDVGSINFLATADVDLAMTKRVRSVAPCSCL